MGQRHSHPSKRLSEFFASSTKTASVDGSTSPSFNFSATTSPTPSFPEGFRWIEGRHFTDDTSPVYPMPNDSDEKARLDSQHYQIRFVFQANQVAPVRKDLRRGIKVLDAGCGTGIWDIEMAKDYPNSEFTGTDITDAFKSWAEVAPPNVRFQIANTLKLPFEDATFDYVFQRLQTGSFRENEWPVAVKELLRVLKPGGWIEFVDSDAWCYSTGPATTKFFNNLHSMLGLRGIYPKFTLNFCEALEAAGLQDVMQDHRSVPVGWGSPEIAMSSAKNVTTLISSIKPQMTHVLGISPDEYDELFKDCGKEFAIHKTYWNAQFAFGRKPS